MASPPPHTKVPTESRRGFDVTCIVGRVEYSDEGNRSPFHLAMEIITDDAQNMNIGSEKSYKFEGVTVTIEMGNND